jgi:quinol monooxygenase YgiN
MIILAGSIRIPAGRRDDARGTLEMMVAATRAEQDCIAYWFAFDVLDDHLIRIFEVWKDEAALAQHRASAHMARFREQAAALGLGGRDMWHYDIAEARRI